MHENNDSELRRLRKRRGLWLRDVSVGTCYTVSHVSDVERGRCRAGRKFVAALAAFYDMTIPKMAALCRRIPRT